MTSEFLEHHTRNVKTFCGLCTGHCGIEVTVADGKPIRIAGDRESPFGRGHICVKASTLLELHDHRDRLNYPLKRAGERGENRWQRISWEQALDEIAAKTASIRDRYGPEAMASIAGTSHAGVEWAAWRWCNLFGTPNVFAQGKNCGEPEFILELATYGYDTRGSPPIAGLTRCVLLWGWNPSESRQASWLSLLDAQKTGTKLVAIDPRRTECAARADLWLQLRPGTDGALALGMMNVMISEGLYDRPFVEKWCTGFDRLSELARQYPPERVAAITGVPAEKVVEAARLYATSKPAVISRGVALAQLGNATRSAAQGRVILRAISGNLDVKGGQVLREETPNFAWMENMHWDRLVSHPLRTRDNVSAGPVPAASVRAFSMFRENIRKLYPKGYSASEYLLFVSPYYLWPAVLEGKPYPIRGIITQGANQLLTVAGARKVYEALKSPNLELHVGHDLFMTPTMALCDYVLPAADCFEQPNLRNEWGLVDSYALGEQPVEPLFERRDDYYLFSELGARLGHKADWPETLEGMIDRFISPTGLSFREALKGPQRSAVASPHYKKYETAGFATPSGKVELAPGFFEKLGIDPLPAYEEPVQSPERTPELAKEFPLVLISGSRDRHYVHSCGRQMGKLRGKVPDPLLQINPETASRLGIAGGDWVYLETTAGRIRQRAQVTDAVAPGVVHADGFWWFPEKPAAEPSLYGVWESNVNAIIPDSPETCSFSGDQYFRGPLCNVYRA